VVLPSRTRARIEETLALYCAERVPTSLRQEIKVGYRIRTTAVTLYLERRADPEGWTKLAVAQLRYNPDLAHWKLYRADRRSLGRWHRYDLAPPAPSIEPLLAEIDHDPSGIFWG
jgi:hypothetical protein